MALEIIDEQNQRAAIDNQGPKKVIHGAKNTGNGLVESVLIAGKPYFLRAKNGQISAVESVELADKIVKPLEDTSYMSTAYSFESIEELNRIVTVAKGHSFSSLYCQVKPLWQKYIDADPAHISLCAADTIFTYFQDIFGSTHYLFFVGNNASGKSNNLRVFQQLAYRNMTTTDLTSANIYQFLGSDEEGQGTLCEDEADNIDLDAEKMRIYKSGYTMGVPVMRTDISSGRKQYRYNTYCFKAFAAEKLPDSSKARGFRQRIVELHCFYGQPEYDITEILNPAGVKEYQTLSKEIHELRKILLVFRILHFEDPFPNVKTNLNGREKQLFSPLIRIFHTTSVQDEISLAIRKYVGKTRDNNFDSLNAVLYRTIIKLIEAHKTNELESDIIWTEIKRTLKGELIPSRPSSYDSLEFGLISHKGIMQTLSEVFGAKPSRHHGEGRRWVFDRTNLQKFGRIYSLDSDTLLVEEGTHRTDGSLLDTNWTS